MAIKEAMVFAPHKPRPEHLDEVKREMMILGSPTIRALDMGDCYIAIEGSHRIAAAHALGVPVEIVTVGEDDEIEHDIVDVDSQRVGDIVAHLNDRGTVAYKVGVR